MGLVNGTKTEDDINAGIIRFAELLLIEAEANIEWDGGDLAIAEANINRVRARVNMPPVTDRSREGLRKALRYERKAELCNEGFRWFDLVRLNRLESDLGFERKYNRLPIPAKERSLNKLLNQNSYWAN